MLFARLLAIFAFIYTWLNPKVKEKTSWAQLMEELKHPDEHPFD